MKIDTIAAISTGLSNSGISIIRVSGDIAFDILKKIFFGSSRTAVAHKIETHTITHGYLYDGNQLLDEVMVTYMKAPRSYTKEDIVEINCHGGIIVTRKILDTVIKNGARPAEPGEFTKRAFLNGRIDLSQAEAVIEVINAKSELSLKNSVRQLKGSVLESIRHIREQILLEVAFIEAALDDPEHISLDGYQDKLEKTVFRILSVVQKLLKTSENGRMLKEGIRTVILGKPNAGKSSLLNLLAREERAIVTDIAGTTRDVLEETIQLNGVTLTLMDTAGIRRTSDYVESLGVEKARKAALEADFILYVADASVMLDENDMEIISLLPQKKAVIILNKTDLKQIILEKELADSTGKQIIRFSAATREGLDELERVITELFFHGELESNDEIYITSARQKVALTEAEGSLIKVTESIEAGMPEDFFSIDLMSAYEELGKIIGEAVDEDLIDTIFKKFCMGK